MSIREAINKKPAVSGAILIVAIAVGVALTLYTTNRPDENTIQLATRAFFSSDEGKSWFPDDVNKVTPFNHNGKPAVRAMIFKCGNEPPFCGYLQRSTESVRQEMTKLATQPAGPGKDAAVLQANAYGAEVTKPGTPTWVPMASRQGSSVVSVQCPDPKIRPELVFP